MIEPQSRVLLPSIGKDIDTLQQRATYRQQRFRRLNPLSGGLYAVISPLLASSSRSLSRLPSRYLLHVLVALVVPIALIISQSPMVRPAMQSGETLALPGDRLLGVGPLNIETHAGHAMPMVGDPPLAPNDAMPMPLSLTSRSEALAPIAVPAAVNGERVKLRNGPGLEYDEVARIDSGAAIQVIGRYGDWFRVREADGAQAYWIAAELVNIAEAAVYTLFDVPESDIPAPPPPKVATVLEDRLNLRDGPGTNYVKMEAFETGQVLSLVEQYQDWVHVATDTYDGWVTTEYLQIEPGIMERVPVAESIPDANPPLVGNITDNSVNLRQGPGTVYGSVGKINADTEVNLLAVHKEWYKIQLSDGTKAWIFGDLLNIAPMARRRVPYTNDIPAPPAPRVAPSSNRQGTSSSGSTSSSAPQHGASSANSGSGAAFVPASGDVASFATQFVGYSYVYGGASPGSGFDCSGLVAYVYRQYGVSLPHNAAAQFSTAYGAMVGGMGNLSPGDLVFFVGTGGGSGITHVGLYIGGGRIVHAMMPGLGVQVSNLYDAYWSSHYYGGLRVYR